MEKISAKMDIIPVALTDQQRPVNNIRTRNFFIIDDLLDEETLKKALDSLIRDHWRKLGARLVTRPEDELLEYHLPQTFDDDYVLFNWSSKHFDYSIDKCNALAFFHNPPSAEDGVTFLNSVASVDEIVRPSTWPFERKDEPPNAPLLYVHLTYFADAMVIAVSSPHALADQLGVGNIMRAWMGLTRGEKPPTMVGYDIDVLASAKSYADYPKKEVFKRGKMHVRRRMEYFFVSLGFIPEFIMHPKEDSHIVFFPRPYIKSLRERYSKEIAKKHGADPGISNGDVLFGILTKWTRMHHRFSRKMTLSQTVNLRGRAQQLESDDQRYGFIHNSLYYGGSRLRVGPSTPASEIAYLSRQLITESTQPNVFDTAMAIVQEMVRRNQSCHICEPFDLSYAITNWCSAWKDIDFSTDSSIMNGQTPEPKRTMLIGDALEANAPARCLAMVLCQTKEGYWCNFSGATKAVKAVRELLEKNPMLEGF